MTKETFHFSTANIALASWLHAEGYELDSIDTSNFPSVFIFSNHSPEMNELIYLFKSGQPYGNVYNFYVSYKYLISEIKNGNNGNK